MTTWRTVYYGTINKRRMWIQQGLGTSVRMLVTVHGTVTSSELVFKGETPQELKERLLESHLINNVQADEIIKLITSDQSKNFHGKNSP